MGFLQNKTFSIYYKRVIFQYIDFYLFIMKIFQFSMKISIIRLEKRGGKVLLTHTNIISNFKCWNWCWNKTCFSAIRSLISSFWPAKKNSSFPRSSFYQNSVGTQFCSIKKIPKCLWCIYSSIVSNIYNEFEFGKVKSPTVDFKKNHSFLTILYGAFLRIDLHIILGDNYLVMDIGYPKSNFCIYRNE